MLVCDQPINQVWLQIYGLELIFVFKTLNQGKNPIVYNPGVNQKDHFMNMMESLLDSRATTKTFTAGFDIPLPPRVVRFVE